MSRFMLFLLAIVAQSASVLAIPDAVAMPVCEHSSHDRLILRVGRDVCAPTLNRNSVPVAAGFMPTRCADATRLYRIDLNGNADRCIVGANTKAPDKIMSNDKGATL